jgi:hypothetical protein
MTLKQKTNFFNERSIKMAKKVVSPFLPLAEKYAKELNVSLKDLSVAALRSMFGHVYYIWKSFKPALGFDKALQTYGTVWEALAVVSFQGGMQALGLKEVKDLPTFGKIVQHCFTGVPAIYEIKRDWPNEHVGHVLWCANPAYGPVDCRLDRNDYYRQEVYLTYTYIRKLVDEAKKVGLKEDIEIEIPTGRCRDGGACACQIILRTAQGDKDIPLPEVKYRFIEDEMGKTEPLLYVLKKQKRSLEDQGPGTFLGFFYTDYLAWAGLEGAVSAKKASDIYLDLWRTFPPLWEKDARADLWEGKPTTAKALADILVYCEEKKFMPYKVAMSNGSVTLTSTLNPYVEVMGAFGFKKGCSYFDVVTKRDQDFINQVLKEAKVDKKFKATLTKSISKGDKVNQIEVSKK